MSIKIIMIMDLTTKKVKPNYHENANIQTVGPL